MKSKRKIFSSMILKKYSLFIFLFVLSIILMFNFKSKKNNFPNLFDSGKNNILSYLKKVNPLYAKTNITNEDMFNFAFYKSLPLDKTQNKILVIGNEGNKEIIEIKTIPFVNTENLNSFLKYLGTDSNDAFEIDSILMFYKNKVYQNVFSSNNTYVINPDLNLIQEHLISDLVKISQKINPKKSTELFGNPSNSFFVIDKNKNSSLFLIITPDTVLQTKLNFDRKKLEKQIKKINENTFYENDIKMPLLKIKFNQEIIENKSNKIEYKLDRDFLRIIIKDNEIAKALNDSTRKILNRVNRGIFINTEKNIALQKNMNESNRIRIFNPFDFTKSTMTKVNNMNTLKIVKHTINQNSMVREKLQDSIKAKIIRERINKANRTLKKYNLDTLEIK